MNCVAGAWRGLQRKKYSKQGARNEKIRWIILQKGFKTLMILGFPFFWRQLLVGYLCSKKKNLPTLRTTSTSFTKLRAISGTVSCSGITSVLQRVGSTSREAERERESPQKCRVIKPVGANTLANARVSNDLSWTHTLYFIQHSSYCTFRNLF